MVVGFSCFPAQDRTGGSRSRLVNYRACSTRAMLIHPSRIRRRLHDDNARFFESVDLGATSHSEEQPSQAQVLWNDVWYAGVLLDQRPGEYLVSFAARGESWKRWIDVARIRPQHILTEPAILRSLKDGRFPKPGDVVACLSVCDGEAGCFEARRVAPLGTVIESRPDWDSSKINLVQIHAEYVCYVANRYLIVATEAVAADFKHQLEMTRNDLRAIRTMSERRVGHVNNTRGHRGK